MKVIYTALVAAGLAAAIPHQHGHQHLHHVRLEKRVDPSPTVDVVYVTGPTTVVYSLNGQVVSEAEVLEGIKNGTLIYLDGAPAIKKETTAQPVQKAALTTATTPSAVATTPAAAVTTAAKPTSAPAPAPAPAPASASSSASTSTASSSSSSSLTGSGVDSDFPDGTIDCGTFPSSYGALKLDYLGLGGWTGIQNPGTVGSVLNNIVTVASGGSCGEGMYCSYACPAGYQKSQWPSAQGATGQSVGGLLCSGGKLKLTNSALSSKLCIPGVSQVKVVVNNQLGQQVAVCRTDYPGTESETVPVSVAAGGTQPLTCPDNSAYYQWQGSSTSAQYYVNPAGYSVQDACQWGDSSKPIGNWAPLNLGVGWSSGSAYVSIFPNKPTTDATLDYKVTVTADSNGQTCSYSNGAFTSSTGSSSNGCTISASSGTITYTFSSN